MADFAAGAARMAWKTPNDRRNASEADKYIDQMCLEDLRW